MGELIRVNNLQVQFDQGATALDSVSFEVPKHQILVLLGHSGAGKSTMLRCLNGLQKPTAGSVVVDGIGELNSRAKLLAHRRRTGMVFQMHHLIGRQTALQNVLMGRLGYHRLWRSLLPLPRKDVELALDCLDRVGLSGKALQRTDQLSGGERQRVGIARALVQQPRLLLADEPLASLDPATAQGVMELMSRICIEDGLTAIFSLHQLEMARRYGDRFIGLAKGRKVFDGDPGDLTDEVLQKIYRSGPHRSAPLTPEETLPAPGLPQPALA